MKIEFHVKHTFNHRWITERGLLLMTGSATLAAFANLKTAALPEIEDLIPADGSLLVVLKPGYDMPAGLWQALSGGGMAASPQNGSLHQVPVVFDGEDLPAVAQAAGLGIRGVIERLLDITLEVRFLGFQPGFAYLGGLPGELRLPRRATPRKQVDAGSVALGGGYCGIYPAAGPGGWHLIGRADLLLFDPRSEPPARFQPGDLVRFVRA